MQDKLQLEQEVKFIFTTMLAQQSNTMSKGIDYP